jgi:dTDP-4-amino-4,6-dideoxygalactose transaminase
MTEPPSRLRKIVWAIAPVWVSRFEAWQQRRAKARRQYERELDRLANPEAHMPVEPREARGDVNTIFARMNSHRRPSWYDMADQLRAERDALHHRLGRHHGVTRAADNLSRFR